MLRAVIIGWEQPRRSVLSRRRWRRRLRLASFWRMLWFTRNPSGRWVWEKVDTPLNTGNAKGFRVSQNFLQPAAGDFACLRPSASSSVRTGVADFKDSWETSGHTEVSHVQEVYCAAVG